MVLLSFSIKTMARTNRPRKWLSQFAREGVFELEEDIDDPMIRVESQKDREGGPTRTVITYYEARRPNAGSHVIAEINGGVLTVHPTASPVPPAHPETKLGIFHHLSGDLFAARYQRDPETGRPTILRAAGPVHHTETSKEHLENWLENSVDVPTSAADWLNQAIDIPGNMVSLTEVE